MPFIGALVSTAFNTFANGGNMADFGMGFGIGLLSGWAAGGIAGNIAKSAGMNLAGIETAMLRGGLAGTIGGLGMAAACNGDIGKSAWQGFAFGIATSSLMWAKNNYNTNKFLKNNVKWDPSVSEADKVKFTQGLKEAGQSPLGQRTFSEYADSDKTLTIHSFNEVNGKGEVGGNDIWLNPDIEAIRNVDAKAYNQFKSVDMGTYMLHEMGHNLGLSDRQVGAWSGTRALNVSYHENPYRAWVGTPARTGYTRQGDVPYGQWLYQY